GGGGRRGTDRLGDGLHHRLLPDGGYVFLWLDPVDRRRLVCDRIALIQTGKILSIDTPDNIINQYAEDLFAIKSTNMNQLLQDLRKRDDVKSCFAFGEYLHVSFLDSVNEDKVLKTLRENGHSDLKLKKTQPTIEDCFINLMKS
ncbi:MAG TPA: hypothetical protein VLB84_19500, partial [Bacteroidia bacterium]|nr:hypothetical protein [Bacteroidia bacterium]